MPENFIMSENNIILSQGGNTFPITGTTASKLYCKYKSSDTWTTGSFGDANELCPCKIIGINRKAQ